MHDGGGVSSFDSHFANISDRLKPPNSLFRQLGSTCVVGFIQLLQQKCTAMTAVVNVATFQPLRSSISARRIESCPYPEPMTPVCRPCVWRICRSPNTTRQIGVGPRPSDGGFVPAEMGVSPDPRSVTSGPSLTFVDCFAWTVLFGDHQTTSVSAVGFIHSTV